MPCRGVHAGARRMGAHTLPRARVWKAAFRIDSCEMARRRTLVALPRGLAADAPESLVDPICALATLSRRQREVVVLHLSCLLVMEIAAMTGTTPAAAAVHLHRAKHSSDPSWRSRMRDLKQRFREADPQAAPDLEGRIGRSPPAIANRSCRSSRRLRQDVVSLSRSSRSGYLGAGSFAWRALSPATPTPSPAPSIPAKGDQRAEHLPLLFVNTDWNLRYDDRVTEGDATVVWASNVPFDERDLAPRVPAIPPWTIASLPPDGIVVTAETIPWVFDPTAGPFLPGSFDPFDLSTAHVRGPDAEDLPVITPCISCSPWLRADPRLLRKPNPSTELVGQAQETSIIWRPAARPVPAEGPSVPKLVGRKEPTVIRSSSPVLCPSSTRTGLSTRPAIRPSSRGGTPTRRTGWSWRRPRPVLCPRPRDRLRCQVGGGWSRRVLVHHPVRRSRRPAGNYSIVLLQEGGAGADASATLEASVTFRVIS